MLNNELQCYQENAIGLKDIALDELHLHFVGRREIPDAPEFREFRGFAESDADVVIERRNGRPISTPFFLKCSMTSVAGRCAFNMTKLAWVLMANR